VDATSTADESAACGRRSRVVLTPRRWCQVCERQLSRATVANKPGRRGEHEISRKPLRRECRVNRRDRGDYARMLILFCMRGCGRIERPAFPAPSDQEGKELPAQLGRIAPRECGGASVIARSVSDEAIHVFFVALWIASLALAMTVPGTESLSNRHNRPLHSPVRSPDERTRNPGPVLRSFPDVASLIRATALCEGWCPQPGEVPWHGSIRKRHALRPGARYIEG
jgi:hypothetical protein